MFCIDDRPCKEIGEFTRTSRIGNDEVQIDIHSLQQRIVDQNSDIKPLKMNPKRRFSVGYDVRWSTYI